MFLHFGKTCLNTFIIDSEGDYFGSMNDFSSFIKYQGYSLKVIIINFIAMWISKE